ncbi:MAG: YraN family protein [Deltaproteobacteria bacterium]|nr:YraN family protein [Deltaproteobacteria bacterium]
MPSRATAASPQSAAAGRLERGRAAEALVRRELERRGWTVLGANVRAGRGELDLCALAGGVLHVVEVRSRVGRHAGHPLESVGPAKRRRLARTVGAALAAGRLPRHREVRYDVATVVWARPGDVPEVQLFEGAFDALDLL